MAGRVQLATRGTQDVFFTDNPEYTYFIKNFQKHTNFAAYTVDHDVVGEIEFGNALLCTIPQDAGDLLKSVSVRVNLGTIPQLDTIAAAGGEPYAKSFITGYTESIGHAMIEYVELYIGDTLVERIPSDFLQIHSEHYVTQTKQLSLEKLIGKPSVELSGTPVVDVGILGYLGAASTDRTCIVDIPFYFYNNPELAVPLCSLGSQEIQIVVQLRKRDECVVTQEITESTPQDITFISRSDIPLGLIKDFHVVTELVALDELERIKRREQSFDYIITQVQSDTVSIKEEQTEVHHKLQFVNPVKELFFIVQRKGTLMSPFDYDHFQPTIDGRYINYEQLNYLKLKLDADVMLSEITGNLIHLRAIQSGIHHSRTQLFRRFYSYSFALEPEKWYPTGQKNFSLVKEQLLDVYLNRPEPVAERELRVYALSYNILRVENGTSRLLFSY
jgi:hypothetical protein